MRPGYLFFYVLFSTDTWRIMGGLVLSAVVTPHVLASYSDLSPTGRIMVYVMMAVIGWAISSKPADWITRGLKKAILGGTRLQ